MIEINKDLVSLGEAKVKFREETQKKRDKVEKEVEKEVESTNKEISYSNDKISSLSTEISSLLEEKNKNIGAIQKEKEEIAKNSHRIDLLKKRRDKAIKEAGITEEEAEAGVNEKVNEIDKEIASLESKNKKLQKDIELKNSRNKKIDKTLPELNKQLDEEKNNLDILKDYKSFLLDKVEKVKKLTFEEDKVSKDSTLNAFNKGITTDTLSSLNKAIGTGTQISNIASVKGISEDEAMKTTANSSFLQSLTSTQSAFVVGSKGKEEDFIAKGTIEGRKVIGESKSYRLSGVTDDKGFSNEATNDYELGITSNTTSSLSEVKGTGSEIKRIAKHDKKNKEEVIKDIANSAELNAISKVESSYNVGSGLGGMVDKNELAKAFRSQGVNEAINIAGKALGSIGAKQTDKNEGFLTENEETKGLLKGVERSTRASLNKTIGVGKSEFLDKNRNKISEEQYMANLQKSSALSFMAEGIKGETAKEALNISYNKGAISSISLKEKYAKGISNQEALSIGKVEGTGSIEEIEFKDKDGKTKKLKATTSNLANLSANSEFLNQSTSLATSAKTSDNFNVVENGKVGDITQGKMQKYFKKEAQLEYLNEASKTSPHFKEAAEVIKKAIKSNEELTQESFSEEIKTHSKKAQALRDEIDKNNSSLIKEANDTAFKIKEKEVKGDISKEKASKYLEAVEDLVKGENLQEVSRLLREDKQFASLASNLVAKKESITAKNSQLQKELTKENDVIATNFSAEQIVAGMKKEELKDKSVKTFSPKVNLSSFSLKDDESKSDDIKESFEEFEDIKRNLAIKYAQRKGEPTTYYADRGDAKRVFERIDKEGAGVIDEIKDKDLKEIAKEYLNAKDTLPSNKEISSTLSSSITKEKGEESLNQERLKDFSSFKEKNTKTLSASEMAGVLGSKKADSMAGEAFATKLNYEHSPDMIMNNTLYGELSNQRKTAAKIDSQGGIINAAKVDAIDSAIKATTQQAMQQGSIEAIGRAIGLDEKSIAKAKEVLAGAGDILGQKAAAAILSAIASSTATSSAKKATIEQRQADLLTSQEANQKAVDAILAAKKNPQERAKTLQEMQKLGLVDERGRAVGGIEGAIAWANAEAGAMSASNRIIIGKDRINISRNALTGEASVASIASDTQVSSGFKRNYLTDEQALNAEAEFKMVKGRAPKSDEELQQYIEQQRRIQDVRQNAFDKVVNAASEYTGLSPETSQNLLLGGTAILGGIALDRMAGSPVGRSIKYGWDKMGQLKDKLLEEFKPASFSSKDKAQHHSQRNTNDSISYPTQNSQAKHTNSLLHNSNDYSTNRRVFQATGGLIGTPPTFVEEAAHKVKDIASDAKRYAAKKIPGVGAVLTAADVVDDLKKGDFLGAALHTASGIASIFPGVGTAASIGIDMLNASLHSKSTPKKVAGAAVGLGVAGASIEAGMEFFADNKQTMPSNNLSLDSMPQYQQVNNPNNQPIQESLFNTQTPVNIPQPASQPASLQQTQSQTTQQPIQLDTTDLTNQIAQSIKPIEVPIIPKIDSIPSPKEPATDTNQLSFQRDTFMQIPQQQSISSSLPDGVLNEVLFSQTQTQTISLQEMQAIGKFQTASLDDLVENFEKLQETLSKGNK